MLLISEARVRDRVPGWLESGRVEVLCVGHAVRHTDMRPNVEKVVGGGASVVQSPAKVQALHRRVERWATGGVYGSYIHLVVGVKGRI